MAKKSSHKRSPAADAVARERTAARKAARVARNEAQRKANVERRANGEPTPWEVACAKRAEARQPKREAWARKFSKKNKDK